MPNAHDLIRAARRNGLSPFELELGHEHLASVPAELAPFSASWNFIPVDDDPFEDPKDRAEREVKEREAAKRKKVTT